MEEPPDPDPDPLSRLGLHPVELTDRSVIDPFFASLQQPLSDFTFSQLYTWRNSLRIVWTVLHNHLCVFVNGSGDLTLLLPPIGETGSDRALKSACELMDDYNAAHRVPDRSRVEYVSDELLGRFDRSRLDVRPMGTDYVYDVQRMIDLAGGDLKSKRQEKNRFMRQCENRYRVEAYDASRHLDDCLHLLQDWKIHQDGQHIEESGTNALKRQKETVATELTLRCAPELGLSGLVVYVTDEQQRESVRAFTFGEPLGTGQSSILIEKTDLDVRGLAQFIFSEFCARNWSRRPLVNVGDDWGLESLAWTKMSYRPVKLLQKYVLRRVAQPMVSSGFEFPRIASTEIAMHETLHVGRQMVLPYNHSSTGIGTTESAASFRPATRDDLAPALELEQVCFNSYRLNKRQLAYLQHCPNAAFVVAEVDGKVVGSAIGLTRQHRRGTVSGRLYSLAVDPTLRGKGIGKKLLRQMLDELAARGAKKVYLEVDASNTAAIALYERLGFRTIGELADYYGPGQHGLHMMHEVAVALAA